ncbi:MAG: DUF3784 domain-containing protein [Bacillus sp. (in: Bacteria)]|nr:DUF3784 domain-containing protein [Bacillus sp. (in: firmicutes)]
MVIILLIVVLFIMLGLLFSRGRGAFLIAGYNTLPQKKKAQYDTVAMCKFMGKMMYFLAVSAFFWFLGEALDVTALFYMGVFLFVSTIVFLLIYGNTGNRFKKV